METLDEGCEAECGWGITCVSVRDEVDEDDALTAIAGVHGTGLGGR